MYDWIIICVDKYFLKQNHCGGGGLRIGLLDFLLKRVGKEYAVDIRWDIPCTIHRLFWSIRLELQISLTIKRFWVYIPHHDCYPIIAYRHVNRVIATIELSWKRLSCYHVYIIVDSYHRESNIDSPYERALSWYFTVATAYFQTFSSTSLCYFTLCALYHYITVP